MISGAELLERAVFLCRANKGGAMPAYWIGTAPFLTAALYGCQSVVRSANPDNLVVPLSLMLALLWMWMNFWHTVYCDSLWRSVADQPDEPWNWRRSARALLTNCALQGPGMFVVVFAAVVTLPFPWAHAFYQNAHIYAARFDLAETSRLAAHSAGLWPKQNWQLLGCVFFSGTLLFVNTLVAIGIGAQLLNSVFGIETALVQNRFAILGLPYLAAASCATFLVIDPIWKAAHVIRCFAGESKRSGADLRLLLRRIAVGALLACLSFPSRAQTPPPPTDKYDRAIRQVLQRPEYEWTGRSEAAARASTDTAAQRALRSIGHWIGKALDWLGDWLLTHSPNHPPSPGPPPGVGLRWSVISAIALCLAVVAILVMRSRRQRATTHSTATSVPAAVAVDITDEAVTPDQLPANEWLQLADNYLRKGDTRLAARAVYLAALAQLDNEKLITLGRHKTNLEYERELARRGRSVPHVRETFRVIAGSFERSWYGSHPLKEEFVADLRTSLGTLRVHA